MFFGILVFPFLCCGADLFGFLILSFGFPYRVTVHFKSFGEGRVLMIVSFVLSRLLAVFFFAVVSGVIVGFGCAVFGLEGVSCGFGFGFSSGGFCLCFV